MLKIRNNLLEIDYIRKRPLLRKLTQTFGLAARWGMRLRSDQRDYQDAPPVLANSFPKSGTHLLVQVLDGLPGAVHYGSFLASMPSITFRERSSSEYRRAIGRIVPGELIPAHLFYSPDLATALEEIHCIHYFIIRDPRDVAISEAHYLTSMNRWHRMHRHFAKVLKTDEERIAEAIRGVQDPEFPFDYPNIRERFRRYQGWLDTNKVLSLRYEALRTSDLENALRRIAEYYQIKTGFDFDLEVAIQRMKNSIEPERSHTFRSGELGQWRKVFTPRLKELMKSMAGDLLIDLGYETDMDW